MRAFSAQFLPKGEVHPQHHRLRPRFPADQPINHDSDDFPENHNNKCTLADDSLETHSDDPDSPKENRATTDCDQDGLINDLNGDKDDDGAYSNGIGKRRRSCSEGEGRKIRTHGTKLGGGRSH